jgi:hypothetical protein
LNRNRRIRTPSWSRRQRTSNRTLSYIVLAACNGSSKSPSHNRDRPCRPDRRRSRRRDHRGASGSAQQPSTADTSRCTTGRSRRRSRNDRLYSRCRRHNCCRVVSPQVSPLSRQKYLPSRRPFRWSPPSVRRRRRRFRPSPPHPQLRQCHPSPRHRPWPESLRFQFLPHPRWILQWLRWDGPLKLPLHQIGRPNSLPRPPFPCLQRHPLSPHRPRRRR